MTTFEIEILNKIRSVITPFLDSIFKIITNFGGQEILILIIIIIYFVFSKKTGQRIAFAIFGSLLVNNFLKVFIARVRPFNHPNSTYILPESITKDATGFSFPSGHSQNSAVTYTAIAHNYKKRFILITSIILIGLVGISRIVLGVHYPSDVVVGIILGVVLAIIGSNLHAKFEDNFSMLLTLYIILALIFLPFVLIYFNKVNTNYIRYKDAFTIYSFYLGFISAIYIENKYVSFNEEAPLKYRILRSIIAIIIVMGLLLGLKSVFPKDNIVFDMIRYFSLSFVGIGVYPLLTKNLLFNLNK